MKTKILVGLAWLIASGYLVSLCFRGMNLASDATYIGGIVGLAVWFAVITPVLVRKLFKEKKHHEKKTATGAVSPDASAVDDRLHNEDRPGDGGNRS